MLSNKKSVTVSEPSRLVTEKFRLRRKFLKWGILCALIACPIVVRTWRQLKRNRYTYVLSGPFRLLNGKDYASYCNSSLWSGNRRNKVYTPQCVYLQRSGDLNEDHSEVTFEILFDVAKDAPANFLADVKASLCCGKTVLAFEEPQWIAPQKQPPRQTPKYSEDDISSWSVRPPEEYILVTIPLSDLDRIDEVVVVIDEIVRV